MTVLSRRVPHLSPLAEKLAEAYRGFGVVGQKLLLAVSGGADSTALLLGTAQLALALDLKLVVASLDHGLRPEATLEVARVHFLASKLGLPFHSARLSLKEGPALEARARRARYQALEGIRREADCAWIATAHTASDQAETLLMRLLRGAALTGASGIRARRGRLLRPLLACSRREVERFLSERGAEFSADPMNADLQFTRARIRARLIPAIESVAGIGATRRLAAFASTAAGDAEYLDELAHAAYSRLLHSPGRLDAVGLRALVPAIRRRVLVQLMRDAGARVDQAAIKRALAVATSAGRATLSRGYELRSAGGVIRCVHSAEESGQQPTLSFGDGWVTDPISGMRIGLSDTLPVERLGGEWLEIGRAPLPLSIRRRRPGDRVAALCGGGTAKLQDLMVDLGIPSEDRDSIPVVCDAAGRILWVIGVWPRTRRVPRARATANATRYLLAERIRAGASADLPRSL